MLLSTLALSSLKEWRVVEVCVSLGLGLFLLRRLRRLLPALVQCWFCHSSTKVKYLLKNSWVCPTCHQYNGFTQDGSYNKDLPQQYTAEYNFSVTSIGRCKDDWYRENSLCDACNLNQEQKVKQLANYVPLSEDTFEEEIENFSDLLERTYKLCRNCEHLVSKILCVPLDCRTTPRRLNRSIMKTNAYKTRTRLMGVTLAICLTLFLTSLAHIVEWECPKWVRVVEAHVYSTFGPFLKKPLVAKFLFHLQPLFHLCFEGHLPTFPFITALGSFFILFQYVFKKSTSNLLNAGSWISLFLLSLYPSGLTFIFHYLMASCGLISLVANSAMLYYHLGYGKKKKRLAEPLPRAPPSSTPNGEECQDGLRRPERPQSRKPLSRSGFVPPVTKELEGEDFGLSGLNLGGPKEERLLRRRRRRRNDSPIVSPSKLSPSPPPKWAFGADSSWSSGISSLERSSTPSVPFDCLDRRDLRFSSFQSPFSTFPPSIPPFACYHFSAQYPPPPHSFIPPSPSNSSCTFLAQSVDDDFHYWRLLYTLPLLLLFLSNVALLWTVYSQAASSQAATAHG